MTDSPVPDEPLRPMAPPESAGTSSRATRYTRTGLIVAACIAALAGLFVVAIVVFAVSFQPMGANK